MQNEEDGSRRTDRIQLHGRVARTRPKGASFVRRPNNLNVITDAIPRMDAVRARRIDLRGGRAPV